MAAPTPATPATPATEERWAALESNPEVLTSLCHLGGVPGQWGVVDVYGLDEELLAFVPQPVLALILLFPCRDEAGQRTAERVTVPEHPLSSSTYYMRQIPGLTNACGTIAMLHAILNNRGVLGLEGGAGILEQFYQETKALGAEERGGKLHDSKEIGELHNGLVAQGQGAQVASDEVRHHFVCLTGVEGHLVELDGAYNSGPLVVGALGEQGLLRAAAAHVRAKYLTNTDSIQFSLMALVMNQD